MHKKVLALLLHLPRVTKDQIEDIQKKLELSCASDAVIAVIDKYHTEMMNDPNDNVSPK